MAGMRVHERLERFRARTGITKAQIARRCGVPDSTVSAWFTGRMQQRLEILPELAKALGTTVAELGGESASRADLSTDELKVAEFFAALGIPWTTAVRRLSLPAPEETGELKNRRLKG